MIYENGVLKRIMIDGGYIENGIYHYYLQDHLGNNRIVAKADGSVAQGTHYYPFGMSFAESTDADKQPYKYNGKELDVANGLNLYDYEARQMDVAHGRFTGFDPLAEKHYEISPYVYCNNNPIVNIDPDGRDWRVQTFYNNVSGKIEYRITVEAVLYNSSGYLDLNMTQLAGLLTKQINNIYSITTDKFISKMNFKMRVVDSVDEIGERDHVVQVVDQKQLRDTKNKNKEVAADASYKGLLIRLGTNLANSILKGYNVRSFAHELGHTGGLLHPDDEEETHANNLMMQAVDVKSFMLDFNQSTVLHHSQIIKIRDNYIHKRLHKNSPIKTNKNGTKRLE